MAFTRVCADADLGPGQMDAFFVDDWEVLVVRDAAGVLHALDGICPHEDTPLVYGDLDGAVLTCLRHFWSFDVTTGRGINPPSCRLSRYLIEVREGDIFVDRQAEARPTALR
jgi:toluene monooxygenase system ferredoxin subunit